MEILKAQLARIQQQLSGLSASQKMLAGALAVIMVMTLLYSARYAGTAEMEPILDQAFSPEEIVRITGELDGRAIPNKVAGDKILIPADRKWQVMAVLGYEQMLPSNTAAGFDKIVQQMSPWDSAALTEAKLNEYRAASLTQIIGRFPGVRSAVVVIDPSSKRRIGETYRASAMVYVTMKQQGAKPGKQLVEAAAACVAGSQAGMSRANVTVVVDGIKQRISELNEIDGGIGGSELLDSIAANERYFTDKIAKQLDFLPDAKISVTVDLENQSIREQLQEYDVKKTFSKPNTEETRTEETINSGAASTEPGAVPNTGMTLPGAGGAGGSTATTTEEKTNYQQFPSSRTANVITPAGKAKVVAASVRVPQSYFINIWLSRNPGGKDPSDQIIATMADAEKPKIRADVMACTGLKDVQAVTVDTYADVLPIMAATTAGGTNASTSSLPLGLGNYGKEIAIGVLALVSLFMVSTMVKKGTPAPVALGPMEDYETPTLRSGEAIAGEASGGEQMLDGMELDDDSVRAQQMIDQVSNMVKENPEGAASLVKRWMNRT